MVSFPYYYCSLVFLKFKQLSDVIQKHPGSLLEGFTQTQVSTLAVKDKLLVAGGFQGELICKVSCSFIFIFDKDSLFHCYQYQKVQKDGWDMGIFLAL